MQNSHSTSESLAPLGHKGFEAHTIFITGAAGYVGAMLVKKFAAREDVDRIVGLDKEPLPEMLEGEEKLVYVQMNTADAWEEKVQLYKPTVVIHAAWQIREMYGNQKEEWRWNIDGSDKIFNFALGEPSVKRLIHFSTVASYGAYSDNKVEWRFKEEDPFRKSDYLYAEEKRIAEEHLEQKVGAARKKGSTLAVAVVRPAAVTGPRGRFMRIRFGLQSALSGQLKGSFIYRVISALVSFVPVTSKWLRQFVHEDDVVGIIETLAFSVPKSDYEIFNLCPPGSVVRGGDMAKAVGKRALPVPPILVRVGFFVMWHATRGKVPTGRGAWKSYSYPIAVSGEKITKEYGYHYQHSSLDAFYYTDGTYEEFVPELSRRTKR
ncbi:NAD-dependent epimerase/dehydratase family protein [Acetobacteraceae bacterium]|nr:NAD-dependent epimerase/dehydratase family protein [Candidatus Parcubacteria bacterium]